MQPLQRYQLGFKYFGPLEKCNDGPYVKASDAHQLEYDAQWYEHNYRKTKELAEKSADQISALLIDIEKLENLNTTLKIYSVIMTLITVASVFFTFFPH